MLSLSLPGSEGLTWVIQQFLSSSNILGINLSVFVRSFSLSYNWLTPSLNLLLLPLLEHNFLCPFLEYLVLMKGSETGKMRWALIYRGSHPRASCPRAPDVLGQDQQETRKALSQLFSYETPDVAIATTSEWVFLFLLIKLMQFNLIFS